MHINEKQEEAKNTIDWPLLIIAWAWSWKTATLTARVEYMIKEKNINPENILMVTFTNKAWKEMRERVAKRLWVEAWNNIYRNRNLPLIWTFHSLWVFFLKETLANFDSEFLNIWLKKDFVIYDESDKLSVLKWIIKDELKLDEKQYPARTIWSYISNAKSALITPKWYEREVDSTIKEIVRDVYYKYEQKLNQNNSIDFDDILVKTLWIMKIPEILEKYQEKYKYLMVDEYQDTNVPQYEIVKLLASKYRNLAVVWDDSQSIYSWRWADMRNILNFKRDYEEAVVIKLEQNYRSTKNIIAWANAVINKNNSSIKKELWTENLEWEKIYYYEATDDRNEAKTVAEIIKEKMNDLNENKYQDNLVLYRTNAQSRQIEEALMIAWIPYRVVWWMKFYDRKEVKDMLSYLKVIFNRDDVVSMKRIINTPSRKIWDKTIELLDNYRESFWVNYPTIIENIDEIDEIKPGAKNSIKWFNEIYKYLIEQSNKITVSDLITEIISKTRYEDYLREDYSKDEFDSRKDNLEELKNVASEYNWLEPRESLSRFLEEVALITDIDTKDERQDYVTLMTVHTSKWLECKRVFLVGLEDWIFPSFRSVNDSFALEEERRLMYVAMTRAREELYISRANERFHFWDYVRNPPSRFISEVPKEYMENYISSSIAENNNFFWSISNNIWSSTWWFVWQKIIKPVANNDVSIFSLWDRVSHHKFGNWLITNLKWEIAEIAFSGKIIKMSLKIAPIKKI